MRSNVFPSIILSLGIVTASFLLGKSFENFQNFGRYVDVKGLDEKIVKSNIATWNLSFTSANNDLKKIYSDISSSQQKIILFLKKQGFEDKEIEIQSISITDSKAQSYSNENANAPRYSANSHITLTTNKVDLASHATQKTGELVESGVVLNNSYMRYAYTDLNSIKPEMLTRATANAREAANSFAQNSNSSVGKIRKANQGVFSITAANSNDQYGDEGSILKKVRVVTSVEFFIN
ncbi:SIMPL domain-containing protein [Fluviispira vulneris]|uniref:SIMPL domain-containing protein n=1 Tax=Fluviispira vulneris TaxID=2763012 RepID=UPI001647BF86|nr:SIMPL domain-containing protein [Fluviispira vulneris]